MVFCALSLSFFFFFGYLTPRVSYGALAVLWLYSGGALTVLWLRSGFALAVLFGGALTMLWLRSGCALAVLWLCSCCALAVFWLQGDVRKVGRLPDVESWRLEDEV